MTTEYSPNEFIAFHFRDERTSEDRLHRAREQIEQNTPYRICDAWLSPRRSIGLLNLCAKPPETHLLLHERLRSDWLRALPRTNRLRVRPRMTILQTGYTTTPERWFERSIREAGESLVCEDAGGIAAFCVVRLGREGEERLFLWSTRPGLRAIANAETPELVVAGTRPRLVHALTRGFSEPSLDRAYVRASLTGWSLGDDTPYEGTTLVPVDGLLRVCNGKRTQHAHPTASYRRQHRIFRLQMPIYRDALREAVEPLRRLYGFELRVSGGKDSRLVAAVLADRGIAPSTLICHGAEHEPEFGVARRLALALGWELRGSRPRFAYRGDLLETVRHNLSLTDGFFATEPRHLAFPVHSLLGDPGPGLVMGHIELQKGGWATKMNESRESVIDRCRRAVVRRPQAVLPEINEAAMRHVDEYLATLPHMEHADYGYWINYRFRVCRWLTSHYLSHSKEHLPVYPLVDEKVTRVVSCAPLKFLVSERLLAETTWKLAPALRDVPLFGGPYRFIGTREARERQRPKGGRTSQSSGSRPLRDLPVSSAAASVSASSSSDAIDSTGRPFMGVALAEEVCEHIRRGKLRDELRELTQAPVWAIVERPTHAGMKATGMASVRLDEYLFTCYQASVLYTDGPNAW